MVAALWGVFIWKEFKSAPAGTNKLLNIMFVFYAVIIIEAMKEDMFEGLLCLFVPGYSIFYLFIKSDSFYLRAIFAALAIGFSMEAYVVVGGWLYETYIDLYEKIAAGA